MWLVTPNNTLCVGIAIGTGGGNGAGHKGTTVISGVVCLSTLLPCTGRPQSNPQRQITG
ncbi:MAG: hypothetical protein J07HQX50_00229 [Haloquadratum sp. J07HQX50]|nr:MAG: hypothetical protein J07HQX50_00229 [Haloquadratum sp. J07HQX50]